MGSIRGSSYYTTVDGPTWTQAETNAVALGGHLVTINDSGENDFLKTTVRDEIITKYGLWGERTTRGEWINHPFTGLRDSQRSGNWYWVSGESASYRNWYPGEPGAGGEYFGTIYLIGDTTTHNSLGNWNNSAEGGQIGIAEIPLSYFSVSDLSLTEGSSGTITITRTGGTGSTQNLTLTSSNGTATAGSDYTSISTTVRFAAGETSKTVSVSTLDDSAVESSETFNLTLTASSSDEVPAQITDGTAVVTINDNDKEKSNTSNTTNNGNNNTVVTGNSNTVGNTTVINSTTNNIDNSTTTNVTINNSSTSNNTTNNTNNITNNFSNVVGNITVDLSSLIQGASSKSDAISGSAKDDALGAGKGADKLTGAGGADQFVFNTRDKFGKKGADTITDFNPEEGDQIILSPDALPGLKTDPALQSVTSKKALKAAQKSESDLIYYQPLGQLFYDQNGSAKGFGSGGLFAVLSGAPVLSADNLGVF